MSSRAAASSRARGRPSRRRQMPATGAASCGVRNGAAGASRALHDEVDRGEGEEGCRIERRVAVGDGQGVNGDDVLAA